MSDAGPSPEASEKDRRTALRELALSDRDTAPVYRVMYRHDYGADPAEEVTGYE